MNLEAINDNIIIELPSLEKENITTSGIFIGKVAENTKSDQGIVVSAGQGRVTANGNIIPLSVKEGDKVLFNKFAGTEIELEGKKYLIIKETDILVKIKK